MMRPISVFLERPSRFLFFTGKGGVGKTSLACAVSVALAEKGRKVLLISTDPASNLGEVLQTEVGPAPRPVDEVPGLQALNIDPTEAAIAYRERIVGSMRGVLPEEALASIEEQLSGACTTEIASFNEFTRFVSDDEALGDHDHVILDTAPTGHTLRLLNLPAAWNDFIANNVSGSSCLGPMSGLQEQKAAYERTLETLTNAERTTLVLVARADSGSLNEAARASRELRAQGIANQRLIINAVFQANDPHDALAAGWQSAEQRALSELPKVLQEIPSFGVPFRPSGTAGIERLRTLLDEDFSSRAGDVHRGNGDGSAMAVSSAFEPLADLVDAMSRAGKGVIMTMGKGGVGKTTVAVDIALQLAAQGKPVLLATTDPADHLTGRLHPIPDNLTIQAIDPKQETARHVAGVMAEAGDIDEEARALLEEELRSPCIEEIAVFSAFARVVDAGKDRFVVLDTAPTGHTLLLLDTTEAYHREVAKNAGNLADEVRNLLPRLRDPDFCRVLVVTLPEATPVHEAGFLQEDLRRAGIEPYAWVINRSLHQTESRDRFLQGKRASEFPYLEEVREKLARRTALIFFDLEKVRM